MDDASDTGGLVEQAQGREKQQLGSRRHLVLPSSARLKYLNEGAANIVYKLTVPYPQANLMNPALKLEDDFELWQYKLLRLRKNLPTTKPCLVAQEEYERHIKPLFQDGDLVKQDLVEIGSGIITQLNKELQDWDTIPQGFKGSRREGRLEKRNGVYLADDKFGLLIDDMSPSFLRGSEMIEFKPKWLAQSPNAPRPSKRCRTCALHARRTAVSLRKDPSARVRDHFCPLDLVSTDVNDIIRVARQIIYSGHTDLMTPHSYKRLSRFVIWLQTNRILSQLLKMQMELDTKGVLVGDAMAPDCKLLTAMTLRDVTCYVLYTGDENGPLEAKLGDLDLKSPDKQAEWRITEAELIAEGWYDGTENKEDKQPLVCNLYPYEWTPKKERDSLVSKWMPL